MEARGDWHSARRIGLADLERGELGLARVNLEVALDLAPPSDSREAYSLADLARVNEAERLLDEAETLLVRAIKLLMPLTSEHGEALPAALTHLARVLHAQARRAEAEAVLNRAWLLTLAGTPPPLHFYEVAEADHPCRLFRAAVRSARIHLRPEAALVAYEGKSRAIYHLYHQGHTQLRRGVPILDPSGRPNGLIFAEPLGPLERAWLEELSAVMTARLQQLTTSLEPLDEARWAQFRQQGLAFLEAGRIDEALAALEQALNLAELWGLSDPRVGISLNALAQLYVATGRPSDARELLRRAVDVLEPLSAHRLELAASLTQLGRLLHDESLLDRAWLLTLQADEAPRQARRRAQQDARAQAYRRCVLSLAGDLTAERALVVISNKEDLSVQARVGFPEVPLGELPVSQALLRHLVGTGAPLLLSDARQAPPGISLTGVRSLACAPVWTPEGEVHGLLYADLLSGARGFSRRDMQSLQLRARQLENELFREA